MKIAICMLMSLFIATLSSAQKNKQIPIDDANTSLTALFSNTAASVIPVYAGAGKGYGFNRKSKEKHRTPKYAIYLTTMNNKLVKGLLQDVIDSSVIIYPGSWSETQKQLDPIQINYSDIQQIKLRKKHAFLKGLLIGAGIGLSPVLVGSLFGPSIGQGGAYVSIITFPVGIITGAIIGGTSRKKFKINGDGVSFYDFKKRIQ